MKLAGEIMRWNVFNKNIHTKLEACSSFLWLKLKYQKSLIDLFFMKHKELGIT